MKRAMFLIVAVAIAAATTGCQGLGKQSACDGGDCATGCGEAGCGDCADGSCAPKTHPRMQALKRRVDNPGQSGPAMPQIAYPYYTHRSPRDFLAGREPDIGR